MALDQKLLSVQTLLREIVQMVDRQPTAPTQPKLQLQARTFDFAITGDRNRSRLQSRLCFLLLCVLLAVTVVSELIIVGVLFARIFYYQYINFGATGNRFFLFSFLAILLESLTALLYLDNSQHSLKGWKNQMFLLFKVMNPMFCTKKLNFYASMYTFFTKRKLKRAEQQVSLGRKELPLTGLYVLARGWQQLLLYAGMLACNLPVFVVPVVFQQQLGRMAWLQAMIMCLVLLLLFKQIMMFNDMTMVLNLMSQKILWVLMFLAATVFAMTSSVRLVEIDLQAHGDSSFNRYASYCFTQPEQYNCSWVQNLIFDVAQVFAYLNANYIVSFKKVYTPGFNIQIIGNLVFLIWGTVSGLIIVGAIVSILINYYKEVSYKEEVVRQLNQILQRLDIEEYFRARAIQQFTLEFNELDPILAEGYTAQLNTCYLNALGEQIYKHLLKQFVTLPFEQWRHKYKVELLRRTDLYSQFLPQTLRPQLRTFSTFFPNSKCETEQLLSMQPAELYRVKKYELDIAKLFQFAQVEGVHCSFRGGTRNSPLILEDNVFMVESGHLQLHKDQQIDTLTYLSNRLFARDQFISFTRESVQSINGCSLATSLDPFDQHRYKKSIVLIAKFTEVQMYFRVNSIPDVTKQLPLLQIPLPDLLVYSRAKYEQKAEEGLMDRYGNSSLHLACYLAQREKVRQLANARSVKARNEWSIAPLQIAIIQNDVEACQIMLGKLNKKDVGTVFVSLINTAFLLGREYLLDRLLQAFTEKTVHIYEKVRFCRVRANGFTMFKKQFAGGQPVPPQSRQFLTQLAGTYGKQVVFIS